MRLRTTVTLEYEVNEGDYLEDTDGVGTPKAVAEAEQRMLESDDTGYLTELLMHEEIMSTTVEALP